MRCLIGVTALALLAVASAETGKECALTSDCEREEVCVRLPDPGEKKLSDKGVCHPKMQEFEHCVMQEHCADGLRCTKHPLLDTPLPVVGLCSVCTSDSDCNANEFCNHPVLNNMCAETYMYIEKIEKKKMQVEEMAKYAMKGEDDDQEDDEDSKGRPMPMFPVVRNSRRNKRGVGRWMVNGPDLRCVQKKGRNSPCKRSMECSSSTCTIEGRCA